MATLPDLIYFFIHVKDLIISVLTCLAVSCSQKHVNNLIISILNIVQKIRFQGAHT